MRRPAVRLLLSWLPVVALTLLVTLTWDLQYRPGNCSDVLTPEAADRFATGGWVLRAAQWTWALAAGAWLLRWRGRTGGPGPAPWRTALAIALGAALVLFSGVLLGQDGLLVLLGLLVLGALALAAAGLVAAAALLGAPRPTGFAAALWTWLIVCAVLAPVLLGALSASEAGTLC